MIDARGVELSFGDVSVLEGADLTVERGEFVAVVGPNGAGKTTLLRTINGLLDPDAGTVELDGTAVTELSAKEVSRQVATVPQDTHVGFSFRAEQVVEMGRTPHRSRLDWSDDADPVDRALERAEIADLRERAVDDLSGGERQRVLLARALAQEPEALLLDEPTANLDINHQIGVLTLVADLVAEGKAALAAIHDLDLAARYCDRIALLADGEIRTAGPPEEVLRDDALAAAFETATAVTTDPATGTPRVTAVDRSERDGHAHVLGVGANARRAVRTLWRAGLTVTVGPVPAGDAAATFAADLGCETVTAPPFESVSDRALADATELAAGTDIIVDAGGPAAVVAAVAEGTPTVRAALTPGADPGAFAQTALAQDGGATARDREVRATTPPELLGAVEDHLGSRDV
jgi:iron complex transport system ATP-binding protein